MSKKIVYKGPNGRLCVVSPAAGCGLTVEQIAEKDVPKGVPYSIVDESEMPLDRVFRDAWSLSDGRVLVDMPRAREIHRQRLRAIRKPLLESLDADFMRAVENGDQAGQKAVATMKRSLRDITAHPGIDAAKTPEELSAAIPGPIKAVTGVP